MTVNTDMAKTQLYIPTNLDTRLRVYAAQNRKKLSEVFAEALELYLDTKLEEEYEACVSN